MKSKIENYVKFEFRNVSKTKEVEDAIEEVSSNLLSMYDDLINSGLGEEEAYIQTIKNLGSFSKEFKEDNSNSNYSSKTNWFEIVLVISTLISAFSVIFIFFKLIFALILLFIGSTSFAVSAYCMYKNARHALYEKKDLDYHNHTLTLILKFVRVNKFFWIISLSYLLALLMLKFVFSRLAFNLIINLEQDQMIKFLNTSFNLFIIFFIINFIIFDIIFEKIYEKYYQLTGESTFIKDQNRTFRNQVNVLLAINILSIFMFLSPIAVLETYYYFGENVLIANGIRLLFEVEFPFNILAMGTVLTLIYSLVKSIFDIIKKRGKVGKDSAVIYVIQLLFLAIIAVRCQLTEYYYFLIILTIVSIGIAIYNLKTYQKIQRNKK